MVGHRTNSRSYDSSIDGDAFDDDLTDRPSAPYTLDRFANQDYDYVSVPEQVIPLLPSDPNGEPDPQDLIPLRNGWIASSKVLMGVLAAASAAMLLAWFSSDATRDIIVKAKASVAATLSPPVAQADVAQLTPTELRKDTAPVGSPASQPVTASEPAAPSTGPTMVANATPSPEEIATAYQTDLPSAMPTAVVQPTIAPAPIIAAPKFAPSPARHIDGEELATLTKRAKEMLAMGDIPAARLLLQRAAEAQDANAALMLARTYDPEVLGSIDVRNITPDAAEARGWYQKAAQYGSPEAQRRLAQLPN